MKIEPTDYKSIEAAMVAKIEETGTERLTAYQNQLANDPRVKDVNMRLRWDLFLATKHGTRQLYTYLNDTHIDSALRKIMATHLPV